MSTKIEVTTKKGWCSNCTENKKVFHVLIGGHHGGQAFNLCEKCRLNLITKLETEAWFKKEQYEINK